MLSDRLKDLVALSGKKQLEIAKDLNFTQQRFNFYVSGRREPDNVTLTQIAQYFNVSVDYLLGVDKQKVQKNTHLSEADKHLLQLLKEHPSLCKLIEVVSEMDEDAQKAVFDFAEFHARKYGVNQHGGAKHQS